MTYIEFCDFLWEKNAKVEKFVLIQVKIYLIYKNVGGHNGRVFERL